MPRLAGKKSVLIQTAKLMVMVNYCCLVLLNVDRSCTGQRQRITKTNTELAVLDYMLVCEEFYKFFVKMEIDEARKYTLTKYATSKGVKSKVLSDHNPMFAKFNINYEKSRQSAPRREIFNLKNKECQTSFFEETNKGEKLQSCFWSNKSFEVQSERFFKSLDDKLHKCFKKIRVKKGGHKYSANDNDLHSLIEMKTNLSISLSSVKCKLGKLITENVIQQIEDDISSKTAERNAQTVKEYVQYMDSSSGNFSQLGMWKLKKQLCPTSY